MYAQCVFVQGHEIDFYLNKQYNLAQHSNKFIQKPIANKCFLCFVLFCFNSPCRNAFEFGFTTHMTRTQMETCGAKTETYHNKKTNSNEMT